MKKKIIALAVAAVAATSCAALAACTDDETTVEGDYVTITCLDSNGEETLKSVPLNPERVAILSYSVLDIMDTLGVGDRVVASAEGTISYLQEYWDRMPSNDDEEVAEDSESDEDTIANLGTLKNFSLETLQQSEPDIIFIEGRQSSYYEELEEIAPVVYLTTTNGDVINDTIENAITIAKIFGLGAYDVYTIFDDYNFVSRIDALSEFSTNTDGSAVTCLKLMWNSSNSFSVLASDGNCSIIDNELGFKNLNETDTDSQHGSTTSWDAVYEINPDYLFVMNRAYITDNDGTSLQEAAESVENQINEVLVDKYEYKGTVVVLLNPDVWYTGNGGIQALDTMLGDLERALLD